MTLTLNQGPFPPPALPGFAGTAGLSATQAARPVPHGRPVEGHAPSPHGFPVLRSISVYRHAVVNTPVARWALIARGTAYSNRFPVPSGGGLPHILARSATTLDFSRPAQRSLAITACRLAESPKRPVCLERLRRFRYLHRRSDSYRLERPSCRVGIAPTEDQHLTRFTAHEYGVPGTRNAGTRRPRWRPRNRWAPGGFPNATMRGA
jgi:hypothetical protein